MRLVVVELDDQVAPAEVDLVAVDLAVHLWHAQLPQCARLHAAPDERLARRLGEFGGAPRSAPCRRERPEVIEGDEPSRRGFLGQAVDRPVRRREVQEGLGDGGSRETVVARDLDASPLMHPQAVVAAPPFRHGDLDHLARGQQLVVAGRGRVHEDGALPCGEQRRRPPLLRRRAEGAEDIHASVHADQPLAFDHAVDLVLREAGVAKLSVRHGSPLSRRHSREARRTLFVVGTKFVRHGSSLAREV
jgi:hypothetical protein